MGRLDPAVLGQSPFAQATFDPVPAVLATPKKVAALEKEFVSYLYRSMSMALWYNPVLRVYSRPGQNEVEFRTACELVRSGRIGKLQAVYVNVGTSSKPCDLPGEKPEAGLDWDRWLGPAPQQPYMEDRVHPQAPYKVILACSYHGSYIW